MKTAKNSAIKSAKAKTGAKTVKAPQPLTVDQIASATVKVRKTLEQRQSELKAKEVKTIFDFVKLANVTDKIENKTASKVYKNVTANIYASEIVGRSEMPTFKQFLLKLPKKPSYSNWDGYKALAKFNVKAQTSAKVQRQNKAEAQK